MAIRGAAAALVLCVGCTSAPLVIEPFQTSGKADGGGKQLEAVDDYKLDIDEPSDIVFVDGKLYVVSDKRSKIYEIDDDGDTKDEIDTEGTDFEAITYSEQRDRFVIGDESNSDRVWFVDRDGKRDKDWAIDDAEDGNSGIEGLAFDDDGHLFVAKEKDPARIIELDDDGDEVDHTKIDFADDLSALAWSFDDNRLYALSDEEHSLYRLDKNLEVDDAWKLPIEHPEGIAFDGDRVYIVSDSEERLYVFELD